MRIRVSLVSLAVACLLVAAMVAPAHAQKKQLDELQAALEAAQKQLSELAAQSPTIAAAVQELSERVSIIEQNLDKLRREHTAFPEVVDIIDDMTTRLSSAEQELARLRTHIADLEQPSTMGSGSSGGGVTYDNGFRFATEDGLFEMRLSGYFQLRYDLQTPSDFSESIDRSEFRLRRGRLRFDGHIGDKRWTYQMLTDYTATAVSLKDFYVDYAFLPELQVRLGQWKLQQGRLFMTSSWRMPFVERAGPMENLRYGRDIGVFVHGKIMEDKLGYVVSFTNGAGTNAPNDNIDFVIMARLSAAVLGKLEKKDYGDYSDSGEPKLEVGLSASHDLVRIPATVAGIEIGNRDVDMDGVLDNARVVTVAADVVFSFRGFEAGVEGIYRHDRFGTILDSMDNSELRDAIAPNAENRRNYFAWWAHASYFIVPQRLLVSAAGSYGRLAVLGIGGNSGFRPRGLADPLAGDQLANADLAVQFYRRGARALGLHYRFTNVGSISGTDPVNDKTHLVMAETQLVF